MHQVDCEVALEAVIKAAEDAGKEILRIYNGSVRTLQSYAFATARHD
jgi:hypothetical protein